MLLFVSHLVYSHKCLFLILQRKKNLAIITKGKLRLSFKTSILLFDSIRIEMCFNLCLILLILNFVLCLQIENLLLLDSNQSFAHNYSSNKRGEIHNLLRANKDSSLPAWFNAIDPKANFNLSILFYVLLSKFNVQYFLKWACFSKNNLQLFSSSTSFHSTALDWIEKIFYASNSLSFLEVISFIQKIKHSKLTSSFLTHSV